MSATHATSRSQAAKRVTLVATYELGRQPFGLASPAAWLQAASLAPPAFTYQAYYPFNAELVPFWFMLPLGADGMSNLAVLLSSSGRNEEAEKLLRSVVQSHPEQYEVVYQLGLLLAEMGKYVEAEKHLAVAVKGMPNHPRAQRNLDAVRQHLAGAGR